MRVRVVSRFQNCFTRRAASSRPTFLPSCFAIVGIEERRQRPISRFRLPAVGLRGQATILPDFTRVGIAVLFVVLPPDFHFNIRVEKDHPRVTFQKAFEEN